MDPDGAVAIVGVACRYPGCETLEEFWKILVNGENHIKEVTPDRWNVEAFFDPKFETPGKTYAKWAGLLDNAFEWDNAVFNVNELEAEVMDPQQKLALEVSFKALENAGIPLQCIKGSNTAVYMCQMNADYANQTATDIASWRNYEFTGTSPSILANRISYTFDLRGPSVSLDTACSGSMVAVHLGAHSILSGESSVALCGGSNFIIGPSTFIALSKSRMASPTGQCRAFSAEADGYVKAEGCGVVILKDLKKFQVFLSMRVSSSFFVYCTCYFENYIFLCDTTMVFIFHSLCGRLDKPDLQTLYFVIAKFQQGEALSDGDRIWGIIKTAIASDGHAESPITNPSKHQLQSLITNVCAKAKITPDIIQYVECHGTGTMAGDPTEAWGVGTVIGQKKKENGLPPVPIGSVKTNIGHLESAAGTAGLLKVLLMMKYGKLVPSLHSERLNPKIDFEGLHVRVSRSVSDMGYADARNSIRVVSMNSNGFGGTAVHSVVQQDHNMVEPPLPAETKTILPILFTAATKKALKMTILDTLEAIKKSKITSLYQLSYTSTMRRAHFPLRIVTFAQSTKGLWKNLEKIKHKDNVGQKVADKVCNTIFVFCGMGSHWNKMGEALYKEDEVFRTTVDSIQYLLDSLDANITILECFQGRHDLSDPFYGQPAIFSIQVGLFGMLKAKHINPSVIVGHSVGEVAASYCAGALTLEQAVMLIYFRGMVLRKVTGGGMLVVGKLEINKVMHVMSQINSTLDMAAENSPTSCTLSGDKEAINEIEEAIVKHYGEDVFLRKLDVKVAYHSKYMDFVSEELSERLQNLKPEQKSPQLPLISTVTGKHIQQKEICLAEYWQQNLRKGVLFRQAFIRALSSTNHNTVVEIGPKPVLRSYIKELASEYRYTHIASMVEKAGTEQVQLAMCSCLEVQGTIKWENFYNYTCPVGDYPRYIFQRKYLYKEPENAMSWRQGNVSQNDAYSGFQKDIIHPFVNKAKTASADVNRYIVNFTPHTTPFVFEHKLKDMVLAPGGTYPEIGIAVVTNIEGVLMRNSFTLEVEFIRPLIVTEGENVKETMVTVFTSKVKDMTLHEFDITTGEVLHASGILTIQGAVLRNDTSSDIFHIPSIQKRCSHRFDQHQLYDHLSQLNFTYGPSLRWGQAGYKAKNEVLLQLEAPKEVNLEETTVHPVFIDSLFQLFGLVANNRGRNQMVPQRLGQLSLIGHQKSIKWAYVKVKSQSDSHVMLDGFLLNEYGKVVVICRGMQVTEMGHQSTINPSDHMFQMSWKDVGELPKAAAMNDAGKHILLFVDGQNDLLNEISGWKNYLVHTVNRSKDVLSALATGDLWNCLPVKHAMLDCIIYGWSLHNELKDDDSGIELVARVGKVCLDIINVLKSLQASPTIPLYILVSGFYALQKDLDVKPDVGLSGCLASSVIGMMRTLTWEVPLQDYFVVDIDQVSDLNLLQDVISNAGNLSAEVAIQDNCLHLCQFMPSNYTTTGKARTSVIPSTKTIELRPTQSVEDIVEYVLETHPESDTKCVTKAIDGILPVLLDTAFIDNTHCYCTNASPKAVVYNAFAHDGEGNRYVVFWPMKITTEKIHIPDSNCIPLSMFPSSLPSLSFWAMAWYICMNAILPHAKESWVMIGSFKDHPICEAIRLLAKLSANSSEVNIDASDTIIVFVKEINGLHDILEKSQNCKRMFFIAKNQSLCDNINEIVTDRPQPQYVMPVDGIFSTSVTTSMQSFKTWVTNQHAEKLGRIVKKFNKKLIKMTNTVEMPNIGDLGMYDYALLDFKIDTPEVKVRMTEQSLFRKDASYLIVGGSKGLGFELAKHIATNGAGRIGILSRTGIQTENRQLLKNIATQYHCKLVEITSDVTNEADLQRKFLEFTSSPRFPLKGVFFGAVVLHDCTITNMTPDTFQKVLSPKIAGAWNIFKLCKQLNLDYFLLHSSIISMCGNVGQSNYAAANAFLDGLALFARRTMGIGQSICWGALDLGLLENNKSTQMKLASHGMIPMKTDDIIRCFNNALLYNPCVVAYSKFIFPTLTKEIKKLPIAAQKIYWWIPHRKGHYVRDQSMANSNIREDGGLDYLKKLVHSITMIEEDDVDLHSSLDQLGADSHQTITIYSHLVKDFGNVSNLSVVEMPMKTLSEIATLLEDGSSNNKVLKDSPSKDNDPIPEDSHKDIIEERKFPKSPEMMTKKGVSKETNNKERENSEMKRTWKKSENSKTNGVQTKFTHAAETEKGNDKPSTFDSHTGDVTTDHMKNGDCFFIDHKLTKAKMFLCEPLESGILNVVVNGATSSYDIRGLTMADIKQVTVKNETLYNLCLQWSGKGVTTMYSYNASLLKGWKEGLMKVKATLASHVTQSNKKSSICVLL